MDRLLKDPEFYKEYHKKDDIAFDISEMVIDARMEKGLTQSQLAKIVGTKQSSIARLENYNTIPSISFLQKIAKALDTNLIPPKFSFLENKHNTIVIEHRIVWIMNNMTTASIVTKKNDTEKNNFNFSEPFSLIK